jgi:hypothetical protein
MRRFGSSGAVDIESLPKSDLVPDSCNLGVRLEADMSRSLSSLNVNCKQRGAAQNRSNQSMKRRRMAMIRFEKDFRWFYNQEKEGKERLQQHVFSSLFSLRTHSLLSSLSTGEGKGEGRSDHSTLTSSSTST